MEHTKPGRTVNWPLVRLSDGKVTPHSSAHGLFAQHTSTHHNALARSTTPRPAIQHLLAQPSHDGTIYIGLRYTHTHIVASLISPNTETLLRKKDIHGYQLEDTPAALMFILTGTAVRPLFDD